MEYNIKNITNLEELTDIEKKDNFLIWRTDDTYSLSSELMLDMLSNNISPCIEMLTKEKYTDINQLSGDIESLSSEYHNHIIDAYVAKQIILSLKEKTHPIGSFFITILSDDPQDILDWSDSGWEKVSQGKCLWGASNDEQLCTTISAGLPKLSITQVSGWLNGCYTTDNIQTGPATIKCEEVKLKHVHNVNTDINSPTPVKKIIVGTHKHKIDSSCELTFEYKDDIYRDEVSTVQPPAFCVNIWVRTK